MSYITIEKKAFFNNADYYSSILGRVDKLCIALKDNAYGHGIESMGQISQEYGIKHCMVRDINEANIVSKYSFESILVLYEIPAKSYPPNYIFSINSLEDLSLYPQDSKIELKIDTGMLRNGINLSQVNQAIELIKENKLNLNGVFTHFCCADEDENDNITLKQEKLFLQVVEQIKLKIKKPFRIHCANTEGVNKVDNNMYDIARIGIGLYGYSKKHQNSLKPVLSLWANKISTRILNKGDCLGYGATYKVENNNTIISNYDIGYGDGFFRLNERKQVNIKNGKKILGRVSMDNFSVNGDDEEICVFDNVTQLATVHDTIEYEILTHLLPRIRRVIV